jgi:hypothetical protein
MLQPLGQPLREHRRARVATGQLGQGRFEITPQARGRHVAPLAQQAQVAAGFVQQGQQQMLDVDLMVAMAHAQVGRAFGCLAREVGELGDEGLEGSGHDRGRQEYSVESGRGQGVVDEVLAVMVCGASAEKGRPAQAGRLGAGVGAQLDRLDVLALQA